ncbi:ribbon-helix-helix domain-containing protein [Commensalibacter oyaizuii]|uniref:Antitoxin-like ribbon-helix-helix domain-containing protein n=1 Tax=Commensalibacter oyaizuii TaxID=3043873 RepID=A0ABT6Q416_9PROT|nr:ribbon-helix-helix domain-containing protein [Commensalibacter sp. TBRC 16381]MDI2091861.1 hypothetical protein [Commensalibacter sp. TBRC 16381]
MKNKSNLLLDAINRAVPQIEEEKENSNKIDNSKKQNLSRFGTKLIAGHFDPKIARQLRIIAAEEDTTVQALLEEALNLLFVKKGKSHIGGLTND